MISYSDGWWQTSVDDCSLRHSHHRNGKMAERLNALVLKTRIRETVSGVRIPVFPQIYTMLEFKMPIPVIVEGNKDGYAVYVSNGGTFENDIWCIVLCDGGHIRHYRSDQIRMHHNATLDLTKHNEKGNK